MQICRSGEAGPQMQKNCVVALGNFDGVHVAHTALLEKTVEEAKAMGLVPAVFTFSKHSKEVLEGDSPMLITIDNEKLELFEHFGIECVFIADFEKLRSLTPEQFVNDILKKELNCKYAVCGFNFKFGHKGAGDADTLSTLMQGNAYVLPPVMDGDSPVSSTRIRAAVKSGDMELAENLLGRPFFIYFPVVHGKELGRTIGVPTMNQNFPVRHIVPAYGVYACTVEIEGKKYRAVANVGVRPTVENNAQVNCETHIIGYEGMLYGSVIKVSFYKKIRSEKKFESVEKLKKQIFMDINAVNDYFDTKA